MSDSEDDAAATLWRPEEHATHGMQLTLPDLMRQLRESESRPPLPVAPQRPSARPPAREAESAGGLRALLTPRRAHAGLARKAQRCGHILRDSRAIFVVGGSVAATSSQSARRARDFRADPAGGRNWLTHREFARSMERLKLEVPPAIDPRSRPCALAPALATAFSPNSTDSECLLLTARLPPHNTAPRSPRA